MGVTKPLLNSEKLRSYFVGVGRGGKLHFLGTQELGFKQ